MTETEIAPPSAEEQLQFLTDLQRLFDEGQYSTTYTFALLMALSDLSVEQGNETGSSLALSIEDISDKFIQYYWTSLDSEIVPYRCAGSKLLKNNCALR